MDGRAGGVMSRSLFVLIVLGIVTPGRAADPAAERGRKALIERSYNSGIWSRAAYDQVWKQWNVGDRSKPHDFADKLRERYGLHEAPYPNGDYPMGIRTTQSFFGKNLTTDCMLCHGGSVAGQSYVGLGNASLDMQSLYEDMARADGQYGKAPFTFTNVRGTSEAGGMAVYLLSIRNPDLSLRSSKLDLGLRDDLCEDPPAWWLLKKKKTMYWTGSTDARSVRSLMQFMLSPLNTPDSIVKEEETFRDIHAYLLTIESPRYPFTIDQAKAAQGKALFHENCMKCHGTYGPESSYPNRVVPIDIIGTDRTRFEGFSDAAGEHYNRSWFGQENGGWLSGGAYPARRTTGYQAPPLDGIWATAPYFHNGCAPTVYHVLDSTARPRYFTRSYRTDASELDTTRLGWKISELSRGADSAASPIERRQIYDTTLPGRGNGGHTFGDHLSEVERMAVIEYLKTL
jgi:mono/diheme cytochrome c family protein